MAGIQKYFNTTSSGPSSTSSGEKHEGTANKRKRDESPPSEDPPPPAPNTAIFASATNEHSRLASWLNSLNFQEAKALNRLMLRTKNTRSTSLLEQGTIDRLATLKALEDGSTHNGIWWNGLFTCVVSTDKLTSTEYPRWQVDVRATGTRSMLREIQSILSRDAFDRLVALGETQQSRQVKMMLHHVSYNADARRVTSPIPANAGRGGSISHLCDNHACLSMAHLERSGEHRDNLDRQRCSGPVLVTFRDVIVLESPCRHGRGEEVEAQLKNSCKGRLHFISLPDASAGAIGELLLNAS